MASVIFNQNAFAIDQFRANFRNGARNYLFYVVPVFPSRVSSATSIEPTYLVRSSSLPGRTVSTVNVNWQGYNYPLGGKTETPTWSVTFTVDKECQLYTKYLNWLDLIHNPETNVHGDPVDYMVDQSVQLLSLDGTKGILTAKLIGCFPTSVSELGLDYSGSDVLSFSVNFGMIRVKHS